MLSVRKWLIGLVLTVTGIAPAMAQAPGEVLRRDLEAGRAAAAIAHLQPQAATGADARMALGFAQFTRAVERLAQGLYRHGMRTPQNPFLPIMRLPVPDNPRPEAIDYSRLRGLYQAFLDDLAVARTTLAAVSTTDGKIVLDLHAVMLSLADGRDDVGKVALRDVIAALGGRRPGGVEAWEVAFDRADALWLAGYGHMLSATMEFVMAHDWQATYEATAHLFFAGAPAPKDLAVPDMRAPSALMNSATSGIGDQIAMLHLMRWPAGDRARMGAVRTHLKAAVALSRETWKAIEAETDDDREWLPSPRQQNRAVPSLPITKDMVVAWLEVLDEFEALLDGRVLLAHWRFNKGIDLRMFFEEPKPFDFVLLLTGHGVVPFLKDGPVLDGGAWRRWNGLFGNNFLGYAFFIN